jgi:predicted aspartyl protease
MIFGKQVASASLIFAAVLTVGAQSSLARESSADIGEVVFAGDSLVLPLKKHEVHPRLFVDFGDGEQHEFIVDTGASVNVIDSSIAESLGLEVVGETEIGAPGGPQIPAKIVKVPLARVGDATIKNAEFVTMDVKGFSRGTTLGVLGVGLFSDYLLTFDRGAGHIMLSNGNLSTNGPGVLPYDAAGGQVEIDIDVAGTTVAAHIDTGSMGEFMLPGEMMESLSLQKTQSARKARLVGGNRDIKFAQLNGNIQFAGFQFDNPNIAFMTPSPGAGNIGSRILTDYVVSIDQKNRLIAFREPAEGSVTSDDKPRRLGVRFGGMPGGSVMTVASVDPGSLGEDAGILAGDVMVSINGRPMQEIEMQELGTLIRGSTPLNIGIERDGASKTIEIP